MKYKELSANTLNFISCRRRLSKELAGGTRGKKGSKNGVGWVRLSDVEMGQILSKRVDGHRFTCMVVNVDLPVPIHTQFHQLPFQECWGLSVSFANSWMPSLTMSAANLKCHINLYFNLTVPRYQYLINSLSLPQPYFPFPP
jgi:hypothetical protein